MLSYPNGDGFNGSEYGQDVSKTSARAGSDRVAAPPAPAGIFWQWSRFSELRPEDLYAAVQLREAVFVVEQQCPYNDADGRDPHAWHLLGWSE